MAKETEAVANTDRESLPKRTAPPERASAADNRLKIGPKAQMTSSFP